MVAAADGFGGGRGTEIQSIGACDFRMAGSSLFYKAERQQRTVSSQTPTERLISMERRYGRPTTISALLPKAAAAALDQRGFASGAVLSRWSEIVGKDLASYAVPIEIKFPRQRNGQATLVLQVASGAAATLLQMKAPLIVERVNTFLGYGAVRNIQALQGPLPQKNARQAPPLVKLSAEEEAEVFQTTQHISSPDIRSAMTDLGLAIARRERQQSAEIDTKNQVRKSRNV